jgi:hypothetical protein
MPDDQKPDEGEKGSEPFDQDSGGQGGAQGSAGADEQLGEAGRSALEKERKARREAEAKLKEAQEAAELAKKSEKEQLEAKVTKANQAAEEASLKHLRLLVGLRKNLPIELAERLQGKDEKELEEDADRLAKTLGTPAGEQRGYDGGARRRADKPDDMNTIIRRTAGRI